MPDQFFLSVVMPVWNEATGIESTLEALAPLRRAGHEIIVVDAGSDDGTAALALPLCDRVVDAEKGRAAR